MTKQSQLQQAAITENEEHHSFWHNICECLSSIFSYNRADNTPPNVIIPIREVIETAAVADDDDSGNSANTILNNLNHTTLGENGYAIDYEYNIELNRLDDKTGFIVGKTYIPGNEF